MLSGRASQHCFLKIMNLFAFTQKEYLCNVLKKSDTFNGQEINNRFSTDFCNDDGL